MEDPKSGKDEPCLPEIASGPLVAPPAPHEDGTPTIEELHKDKFPRLQYVETQKVCGECYLMNGGQRRTIEKKLKWY